MEKQLLFSGNSNKELAESVAKNLRKKLAPIKVSTFSDGEVNVEIDINVRGSDTFIIQSTDSPAEKNLMELVLIADALKRASASSITAVIPYFGYARQDRRVRSARVPISARVIAEVLTSVGISRVITLDIHSEQIQGFFSFPVDNIYTSNIMCKEIIGKYKVEDLQVVSPDTGGVIRARSVAKTLGVKDLATFFNNPREDLPISLNPFALISTSSTKDPKPCCAKPNDFPTFCAAPSIESKSAFVFSRLLLYLIC